MKSFRHHIPISIILFLALSCNKIEEILTLQSPQGITVTAQDEQVTITWNDVIGASSYNIYWSETTGVTVTNGELISNATSPYLHTGSTLGTTYYYIVASVNEAGEGLPSSEVSATLRPSAPENIISESGEEQVTISWDNVSGATSYNIYWSEAASVTTSSGTLILNVSSPYIHNGLTYGAKTYYYVVTAVNNGGESDISSEVDAILRPSPPVILSLDIDNDQTTLTWDNVLGATSYNIYWSLSTGVTLTNGASISNVANPYAHTGLTFGTNYYYIITALNDTGESDPSEEVSAVPGCITAPAGIVSWWPGDGPDPDDPTGAVVEDIIGVNNGELYDEASYAEGMVGQAFSFTNNPDLAGIIAGGQGLTDLLEFTAECWIWNNDLNATDHNYVGMFSKFHLSHQPSGPAKLSFWINVADELQFLEIDNVLKVGVWQHIAASYDGAMMHLYVDGVEIGSLAESRAVDVGSQMYIGDSKGLVDEISIYNRALTSNEILAIFNADIAGKCK